MKMTFPISKFYEENEHVLIQHMCASNVYFPALVCLTSFVYCCLIFSFVTVTAKMSKHYKIDMHIILECEFCAAILLL